MEKETIVNIGLQPYSFYAPKQINEDQISKIFNSDQSKYGKLQNYLEKNKISLKAIADACNEILRDIKIESDSCKITFKSYQGIGPSVLANIIRQIFNWSHPIKKQEKENKNSIIEVSISKNDVLQPVQTSFLNTTKPQNNDEELNYADFNYQKATFKLTEKTTHYDQNHLTIILKNCEKVHKNASLIKLDNDGHYGVVFEKDTYDILIRRVHDCFSSNIPNLFLLQNSEPEKVEQKNVTLYSLTPKRAIKISKGYLHKPDIEFLQFYIAVLENGHFDILMNIKDESQRTNQTLNAFAFPDLQKELDSIFKIISNDLQKSQVQNQSSCNIPTTNSESTASISAEIAANDMTAESIIEIATLNKVLNSNKFCDDIKSKLINNATNKINENNFIGHLSFFNTKELNDHLLTQFSDKNVAVDSYSFAYLITTYALYKDIKFEPVWRQDLLKAIVKKIEINENNHRSWFLPPNSYNLNIANPFCLLCDTIISANDTEAMEMVISAINENIELEDILEGNKKDKYSWQMDAWKKLKTYKRQIKRLKNDSTY